MSGKQKKTKERRNSLREGSLSQKILISIGKVLLESGRRLGDAFLPIITLDLETMLKNSGMKLIYFNPYSLTRRFNDLERRNYIKLVRTKRERGIKLTNKGKLEIIKYKTKLKLKKQKWDGIWRGICWDVPEISRKDRDYLRRQLKWLGLKEMQKSFWVFPFEIKEELTELAKLYKEKLAGDIRFLSIKKIEDDKDLRKYFNLN